VSKKDLFVPLKDVESVVSDLSAGLSAYEISYRKEKCVPVFKLKKAIKWLEKDCQDKLSGDMNIGAISWDIFMLKLGLSEKKEARK